MRYYIADQHFFHEALNRGMDCRGFSDVEEMNEYMITKWNHKVHKRDDVIILGDFSWGSPEQTKEIIDRLNGRLYLIQGNHDKFLSHKDMDLSRFKWIKPYEELSDDGRKVVLSHYPIMCYKGQYNYDKNGKPRTYMLHGHVHDTTDQRLLEQFQDITRNTVVTNMLGNEQHIPCNIINCFCMYSDYEPLSLDEWIVCDQKRREKQEEIKENINSHLAESVR